MAPCQTLLLALFVLALSGCSRGPVTEPAAATTFPNATPMMAPALRCPRVHPADAVHLDDNLRVVGVVAGGRARAYLLTALSPMMGHVINDLLGDVPVTVTFCDRTECVRTFTDDSRGQPLEMSQMGYFDGLLLRVGSGSYRQATGEATRSGIKPLPYRTLAHTVTTWKKWRAAHPDTAVFTGE